MDFNNKGIETMSNRVLKNPIAMIALILCLAAGAMQAKGKEDVATIVQKVRSLYNSTTSARVTFQQAGKAGTTSGTLTFTSGNRYRLEFPKQTMVSDGAKTWSYYPDRNRVVVSKASKRGGLTPSEILTAFPGSYRTTLKGEGNVNGQPVWIVVCDASADGAKVSDVTRATLYIDKKSYRFRQVDIESPTLGSVQLVVKSATYNVAVPATTFSFTAPRGAKVVDLSR
jgi:outer membrane lipoprotein carrier protein